MCWFLQKSFIKNSSFLPDEKSCIEFNQILAKFDEILKNWKKNKTWKYLKF